MKLTFEARQTIKRVVREHCGAGRIIDVGLRADVTQNDSDEYVANQLLWGDQDENTDVDFSPLEHTTEIAEDPRLPGSALLDLYVYKRADRTGDAELITNIEIAMVEGKVVGARGLSGDFEDMELMEKVAMRAIAPAALPEHLRV
jgi:hypothetical protein